MKKKKKEKLKFSKRIVILMFVTVMAFTVTMTVTYIVCGSVPDELIVQFFGFFGIEGGALGIIKVSETLAEKHNSTSKKGKKNE